MVGQAWCPNEDRFRLGDHLPAGDSAATTSIHNERSSEARSLVSP